MMRAIPNVHAGPRFPSPDLGVEVTFTKIETQPRGTVTFCFEVTSFQAFLTHV